MSRALLLAVLSALSGCCLPDLDATPEVILGTGEVEFEALPDGFPDIELVNGIQGGWHVWGSVRATGLDWRDVRLDFSLTDLAGEPVSEPSRTQAELGCCEGSDDGCAGFGELVGFPVLVEEPALALGRDLLLQVEMTDADGVVVTAEREVTPSR